MKRLLLLPVAIIACTTQRPPPEPLPSVYVYAADSEKQRIVRTQNNAEVLCKDPSFDDYVCLQYEDFQRLLIKCTEAAQR